MLIFLSVLIGVLVVAVAIAGLLALISNPSKLQNVWFFLLTMSMVVWIPSNFIDSNFTKPLITNLFLKLDFSSALLLSWTFMLFVGAFKIKSKKPLPSYYRQTLKICTAVLNAVLIFLAAIGVIVSSSVSDGTLSITYGKVFPVYVLVLLLYFLVAFTELFIKRRRAGYEDRRALDTVFAGTLIATVANLLTNLVFPLAISNHSLVKELNIIGYIGLGVMVFALYLAITKQKLFDIRLIVTRSLAYLFSLGALSIGFTVAAFTVTSLLFKGQGLTSAEVRWVYTLLAVGLAYTFPFLKHFFDKVTSRLFYRDSYDTQAFLDQLNNILVATFELQPLLHKSAEAIETNLKPTYSLFGLKETDTTPRRFIGTKTPHFNEADIALVTSYTPKMRQKMLVTDLLDERDFELQKVLRANNVAVIARLTTSAREEGIGYLILGPKKSGNIYNSEDIKNIEIVANELVIAIQNALRFEEIQNFNLTLQSRVNEATAKLRRANQRLKELDETKDDFISMASHQLRTPLTSVKGYISLVLEGDAGKLNEQQRKLLEQSFFSSQRMVYLIADLLNVSRLKTGKFIIEPSPVNLADMVEQEMEQLKQTAAGKDLTLTYEKPKSFPTLMLDETKTRQVIMNFADNAIYYTPAGGHIRVELAETPASVELRVVDDGIGVPKAEQHHLFNKFYRAGNARKARPDGTGLGLFMAKKVVVAQGGAIIFESTEGKGSTFGFVFSKTKLAPRGFPDPVKVAKTTISA